MPGYDPGPVDLADARFEFVAAPTVSADGELVVLADLGSALVRVANLSGSARAVAGVTIQPGQVAAIAGQGPTTATPPADRGDGGSPTAAWLVGPIAARFGPNGLIWIDDAIDARIRVINPTSAAVTVLGTTIQPNTIETVLGAAGSYLPGDPNGDGGPAQAAALSRLGVFTNFTPRGDLLVAEGLGFGKDAFGVVRYVNLGSTPVDLGAVTVQPGEIETVAGSGVAVTGPTTGDGGPASSATFRGSDRRASGRTACCS